MLVCIVGDRLVSFEERGRLGERRWVCFSGGRQWLFRGLGGWPLNSTSPFIHSLKALDEF